MLTLTIIIPTFNSANTLADCLESIVFQTLQDIEVWIIDGVSSDATIEIIKEYDAKYNYINYITEPDKGIYDAMNKGIDLAKGEWLYFLGSDDMLDNNLVLAQIATEINDKKTDLIYGNVLGAFSKNKYEYPSVSEVFSTGIHHQGVFYKKVVFSKLGKYDLRFLIAADYHFTLKVFADSALIKKYVNIDIATYGETGLSSHKYDYKYFSFHYRFLKECKIILEDTIEKKLIKNSIYCCIHQVTENKDSAFTWSNFMFYMLFCFEIEIIKKLKYFYNMLYWFIKPKK